MPLSANMITLIACTLLSSLPALAWAYFFYKKAPIDRRLSLLCFFFGMVSVVSILFYKYLWQFYPNINLFMFANQYANQHITIGSFLAIPVSIIISFGMIGFLEEYGKHLAVRVSDKNRLMTIDDAINASIIAALGFSFVENILYFYYIWEFRGPNNLIIPYFFRSTFSTFAHIFFSGIFGYFYGVAHFADEIWKEEVRAKRGKFIQFLHKILMLRPSTIFRQEKMMQGLLFSMVLHAAFNILLELDLTYLVVPYLFIGFVILTYLLDRKEDHKVYGRVIPRQVDE